MRRFGESDVSRRNPDHRHRRLLRARRERPRGHDADEGDELTAFQRSELHWIPASQCWIEDIELAMASQRVSDQLCHLLVR